MVRYFRINKIYTAELVFLVVLPDEGSPGLIILATFLKNFSLKHFFSTTASIASEQKNDFSVVMAVRN